MSESKIHKVGIILNGVTGRMGMNQHLLRSIVPIIQQGGVLTRDGVRILPDPVLVGRNPEKLAALAEVGVKNWSSDQIFSPTNDTVFISMPRLLDAELMLAQAAAAGTHIYCEKPTATDTATAIGLAETCEQAGVKNGVVQDKLWLPGILKLQRLIEDGFFGRILSVRGEFGYWVFEGHTIPAQRPSWNYRKEDDGGIIVDMLCHWRYVLDNVFGKVKSLSCIGTTHIPERIDEQDLPYKCTADDAAYATFELEGGIIANINSSWCTRVRRDDLLTLMVDGTKGSAMVGLRECRAQAYEDTPKPVWNPDIPQPIDFYQGWSEVAKEEKFDNAFKVQWELFLKHVVLDEPFRWTLREGAKGVQLAELGIKSWEQRSWVSVPGL